MAEHTKDPEHVAAGYKATIHNPNVSKEAKDHAWDQLHKMGIHEIDKPTHQVSEAPGSRSPKRTHSPPRGTSANIEAKNEGNVIGGFKASLKNPNVSKEAKQHAESELEERGVDLGGYEKELKDL